MEGGEEVSKLHYSGDVNIEHGGFFYAFGDPWATAVRCTPCSDAGGPDNMFWIEVLYVNKPEGEDLARICECCDLDLNTLPPSTRDDALVYACIGYGHYDKLGGECIRIGPPDPFYGGREKIEPTRVLRAGTSLKNYVRKQALHHCF